MNQIFQRTITALIALILAAGCDSLPDPKTITAAYPPIEAIVYTPITVVTPTPDDTGWTGTWRRPTCRMV